MDAFFIGFGFSLIGLGLLLWFDVIDGDFKFHWNKLKFWVKQTDKPTDSDDTQTPQA